MDRLPVMQLSEDELHSNILGLGGALFDDSTTPRLANGGPLRKEAVDTCEVKIPYSKGALTLFVLFCLFCS